MAKECFENEEVAELLNENFVSIKLDRDERPDIDRRYQNAVGAMGFGGGWPLSVFLTPDRKPFFGGTYFPPEDGLERPGFKKVLKIMADLYRSRRSDINEASQKIADSIKTKALRKGDLNKSLIRESITNILSRFDTNNGGFGVSPKFPMPGAVELLINRYYFDKMESFGFIVGKTLESMAKGGFHDQIGGGFHRYSVDESWIMPHFEKMADDNAWQLRNYVDAYSVFNREYFKVVAEGIINFIRNVLSDPEGGFYASQDADVTPDDEGGYFTWTDKDFRRILNDEEYRILSLHLMNKRGSMHHDKSKRVLFVSMEPEEIADKTGMDVKKVSGIINAGRKKLLSYRNKRKAPFIDRTLYTSLNGMMAASFMKAYRVLKNEWARDFAVKSLKRIIRENFVENELFHTKGVKAVLDDYIYLTEASVAAYEVTADQAFLAQADILMTLCLKKFWDNVEGGFFDTEREVLGTRLKGIEDIPHPAANSIGIILLLKLYELTGKKQYLKYAETALKAFSPTARDSGIHSAYYFCALDAYFHMLKLTMQTSPESKLAQTALFTFRPYISIVYKKDAGCAVPCIRDVCYEPVYSPGGLKEFLSGRDK
jgi:uncharacterized protein YyaL (SSP411 family)